MQGEIVGAGENFVECRGPFHVVLGGKFFIPVEIVTDHLHAESTGADGDLLADAADADDADGLAHHLVARLALPSAGAGGVTVIEKVFLEGEQQQEGMLGHGGVIDTRSEEHGDLELRGAFDIDLVEPDAVFADDLEPREGFFDHGARDGVITADEGVKLAGEFEHAGFGQRSAFTDDFETGGGDEVVMPTWRVLE